MFTLVQDKVLTFWYIFVNSFARSILMALTVTPHLWRKFWHSFLSLATCAKSLIWHPLPMARLFHLLFGFNTCLHKRPLSYLRINSNLNKINFATILSLISFLLELHTFLALFLYILELLLFLCLILKEGETGNLSLLIPLIPSQSP